MFIGPKGAQLRRANFTRTWSKALTQAKLSGFHFHDLSLLRFDGHCVRPTGSSPPVFRSIDWCHARVLLEIASGDDGA
ncbi:hypothetical protein Amac_037250 [Acrocarpospora macrocephala]|uniref:Uncharacterized protein n=1 Tax=Acrocarpospora macrocephala TaxID=150177 RepID=A0A5M3WVG4_9ACTN|nr:hypothetical protein Amac_037250 [Acrocarpospora macrocephala]